MILAAGLGTRLRPLTANKPKALIDIGGITLLEIAIRRLKKHGVKELVINVHHFADQIEYFLHQKGNFGITIHLSDERQQLLDTGGGLKKAAHWLKEQPFFLVNADVLTNMHFGKMWAAHQQSEALATLAVRQRQSSRHLLFSQDGQLVGWQNNRTDERRMSRDLSLEACTAWAFSGIQIVDPALFQFFLPVERFSMIDVYLQAAREATIRAYPHDMDVWLDVGKPPAVREAESLLTYIDL